MMLEEASFFGKIRKLGSRVLLQVLEVGKAMEIERRLEKVEWLSFKIYQVLGSVFGILSLLALALFGFAKLIQYLWLAW
jgi:hypothetical protein